MASRMITRLASTSAGPSSTNAFSLYQTLAKLPNEGIGSLVAQKRWAAKGIDGSYWEIKKVKLKNDGQNGKAWGKLVWKGVFLS